MNKDAFVFFEFPTKKSSRPSLLTSAMASGVFASDCF